MTAPLPTYLQVPYTGYSAIMARMMAQLAVLGLKSTQGSNNWNRLSPAGFELTQWAQFASGVQDHCFVITATGLWLDYWGQNAGVQRTGAQPATGTVTFTAPQGTLILAGTVVSTLATSQTPAQRFSTNAAATVLTGHTTIDVPVTALVGGLAANVPAHAIALLGSPVTGVTGVDNAAATAGGLDQEADGAVGVAEHYRGRILLALSTDQFIGSRAWYVSQATALGAGVVKVDFLWNGPGTVRLTILDANGNIPSPPSGPGSLPQTIQDVLDPAPQGTGLGELGPLAGTVVTVVAATDRPLSLRVPGLVVKPGYVLADVQAAILLAVQAYYNLIALSGGYVRVSKVGAAVVDTPGVDYFDAQNLRVNGGTADIALGPTERPSVQLPVSWS